MWKLLHDLVLVVLLDFDVDEDAMRTDNSTMDPSLLSTWQELVRFYLYEWGFVCASLYQETAAPPSSILLLAFAWLVARSQLVEHRRNAILQLYMGGVQVQLPPYANKIALSELIVGELANTVVQASQSLHNALQQEVGVDGQLHQIQSLAGRIHTHRRSLEAACRAYTRLQQRIATRQLDTGADADQVLSAYAAQVVVGGKRLVDLHVRAITERLSMAEDEKLFYKWINGLLLQYKFTTTNTNTNAVESVLASDQPYASLHPEILATQQVFQQTTALFEQVHRLCADEKGKWKHKPKTRTQQAKMEDKMAKLREDIATQELFDPRMLFLTGFDAITTPLGTTANNQQQDDLPLAQHAENLRQLQAQLEHVMREITTQYCHAELV